jgi:putative transposase
MSSLQSISCQSSSSRWYYFSGGDQQGADDEAKRFTEDQIIGVSKEAEAGAKAKELCRRHGIAEATFYNWKAKYAGMTVSDLRRLKELESENAKLKRLLAEAELDKAALKDLLERKW